MASRKIKDLCVELQPKCKAFLAACEEQITDAAVIIVCTFRDGVEQNRLYAQGRTTPGMIITNAKAGESAHNKTLADGTPAAEAFDYGVIVDGKYDAGGTHPAWIKAGQIAMQLGLEWYGAPGSKFKEKPHCQLPQTHSQMH